MSFDFSLSIWVFYYVQVSLIFTVLANYCIFQARKEYRKGSKNFNLLSAIFILNIISAIIPLFFTGSFSFSSMSITDSDRILIGSYFIAASLLPNLVFFISYGVLFIIYGTLNRKNKGGYLLVAGILWTIFYGLKIFTFDGRIYWILNLMLNLEETYPSDIFYFQNFIFSLINISSFISIALLIIYGYRKSEKNFLFAGLILFLIPYVLTPVSYLASYYY